MKKSKTYYMHTIEGRPAFFTGDQICFMTFYGPAPKLARSLKQIRREQQLTKEYRLGQGFDFNPKEYSYRRVTV